MIGHYVNKQKLLPIQHISPLYIESINQITATILNSEFQAHFHIHDYHFIDYWIIDVLFNHNRALLLSGKFVHVSTVTSSTLIISHVNFTG